MPKVYLCNKSQLYEKVNDVKSGVNSIGACDENLRLLGRYKLQPGETVFLEEINETTDYYVKSLTSFEWLHCVVSRFDDEQFIDMDLSESNHEQNECDRRKNIGSEIYRDGLTAISLRELLYPKAVAELNCYTWDSPGYSWSRQKDCQTWSRLCVWAFINQKEAALPLVWSDEELSVMVITDRVTTEYIRFIDGPSYCNASLIELQEGKCRIVNRNYREFMTHCSDRQMYEGGGAIGTMAGFGEQSARLNDIKTMIYQFEDDQCDWRDVALQDIGVGPDLARIRMSEVCMKTCQYAKNNDYIAGYPTWHVNVEADVMGVFLLRKSVNHEVTTLKIGDLPPF